MLGNGSPHFVDVGYHRSVVCIDKHVVRFHSNLEPLQRQKDCFQFEPIDVMHLLVGIPRAGRMPIVQVAAPTQVGGVSEQEFVGRVRN